MKDFKQVAADAVTGSFIMQGRDAIQTDFVIAGYPDGITIIGADLINTTDEKTGEPKQYAACIFAEDEKHYINAGSSLTNIVKQWAAGYDDCEAMSNDLKAAGGVKIKLRKGRTKKGNTFTEVIVV